MTQRTDRIDELLRQEIGQALEREVTDPRIGFVTVTDVETSPDLAHARVWVSVIGTPEQRKVTMAALRNAMPFVRRGLNSKIRLRRIPELEVRLDDTAERGTRMLHILDELAAGHDADSVAPLPESLPTPVRRLPHEGDAEAEPAAEGPARPPARRARQNRSANRPADRARPDQRRKR
jgi:ribosome-binding factor A